MKNCKDDHGIWGTIGMYNGQGLQEALQPVLAQVLFLLIIYLWEKKCPKDNINSK